eukprot:2029035-Prymnesium_polylepis.1
MTHANMPPPCHMPHASYLVPYPHVTCLTYLLVVLALVLLSIVLALASGLCALGRRSALPLAPGQRSSRLS